MRLRSIPGCRDCGTTDNLVVDRARVNGVRNLCGTCAKGRKAYREYTPKVVRGRRITPIPNAPKGRCDLCRTRSATCLTPDWLAVPCCDECWEVCLQLMERESRGTRKRRVSA